MRQHKTRLSEPGGFCVGGQLEAALIGIGLVAVISTLTVVTPNRFDVPLQSHAAQHETSHPSAL